MIELSLFYSDDRKFNVPPIFMFTYISKWSPRMNDIVLGFFYMLESWFNSIIAKLSALPKRRDSGPHYVDNILKLLTFAVLAFFTILLSGSPWDVTWPPLLSPPIYSTSYNINILWISCQLLSSDRCDKLGRQLQLSRVSLKLT